MWRIDTPWFDVALVAAIFAFGNVCFGHFEAHRPRWRRALKVALMLGLTALVVSTVGRAWLLVALGMLLVFAAAVHAWWLPKHGVDGWTAEPRERYYALLGLGPDGQPRRT